MIYVIPAIALAILVSCVDSPRFTSIMTKLASTDNYPSLIFNLIAFGAIIFAFIYYYRLPLALGGGGGSAVKPQRGQFILLCLVGVLEILFFESFAVLTGGRQGLDTNLPHMLSAIIVAPIVEEMFYRHVLLRLFLRTYRSSLLAILYSAILFAMLHSQILIKPILIVPYLTSGIVLGYLYYKSNSVWFCILMHSLANAAGYLSLVLFF